VSDRDVNDFEPVARSFVGRRVFPSVATNTVKLMIDSRKSGPEYLWIDPPWKLLAAGAVATSSDECPDSTAVDYNDSFAAFSRKLARVEGAVLERISLLPDGAVEFGFGEGLALYLPATTPHTAEVESPSWYDHWYARTNDAP
jgi:hypothetical protein